jgi:hypothetical protein
MTMTTLLLASLLSAVLVFLVSSIVHMATPWHAGDFEKVPNEDGVMAALRPFNLAPGSYVMPRPSSMKDLGSPEFKAKHRLGPSAMLHVLPGGQTGMGQQLVSWFLYSAIVALMAGYVTSRGVGAGAPFMGVAEFVGAVAFMGYAVGLWQMSIWYRRSWVVTLKSTIDGIVYGALTGLAFAWLWPR